MNGEAVHEAGSGVHGAEAPGAPGSQREPSEEELRAAYEAELSRLTSADVMVNACVTLLSIGSRRLGGPAGEEPQGAGAGGEAGVRDLEQVREAIDGARALLGVLERRLGKELGPLRDALSRLQLAYAREARGAAAAAGTGEQGGGVGAGARQGADAGTAAQKPPGPSEQPGAPPEEGEGRQPGPAESSGRLWVPGH